MVLRPARRKARNDLVARNPAPRPASGASASRFPARRRDGAAAIARQRPRRQATCRQWRPARQSPGRRSCRVTSRQHRRFAAEQMRRAGDVQEQAVAAHRSATSGVKRSHQSAIRSSSAASAFSSAGTMVKRLHHGAGIGQRLAFIKSQLLRPRFQRMDIQRVVGASGDDQRRFQMRDGLCAPLARRVSRSVGRRGSHSARICAVASRKQSMFGIPFHDQVAQSAQPVARQSRVESRGAPIIVIGETARLRTCQRVSGGAGLGARRLRAAGSAVTPLSPPRTASLRLATRSRHLGWPCNFQQQRAHMRTGQNVGGGRQGVGGIARCAPGPVSRIAAQFQQARGRERAIFQRLIIRPHPEEAAFAPPPGSPGRRQSRRRPSRRAKTSCRAPGRRPPPSTASAAGHAQRNRRPVRGQAIARQEMAQFRQFFTFVHDMFQI